MSAVEPPSGSSGAQAWSAPAAPSRAATSRTTTPTRKQSRLRSSTTSFGIVGKTVITVLVLAVGALIAFGNILGVPVYLIFAVWVLRDLWSVERRGPAPRRPVAAQRPVASPTFPPAAGTDPTVTYPPAAAAFDQPETRAFPS